MRVKSRNFNDNYRLVTIEDVKYVVWFKYSRELYEKKSCEIIAELYSIDEYKVVSKIIEIPFKGDVEKITKYKFFSKHSDAMEQFALDFHLSLKN